MNLEKSLIRHVEYMYPQLIDIAAFDKLAEICSQYLNKGKKVLVEGRLKRNEWVRMEPETLKSRYLPLKWYFYLQRAHK